MPMIVRAFTVLPGKEDDALAFARECGDIRKEQTASFMQSYGVRRESWHLQRAPHGTFVIVVTDVEEPPLDKALAYGVAQGGYERWFKDNIKAVCGVDPDTQPLGPPTETIFSFDSAQNRRKSLDAPVS
jgi:hypothetical protein